MILNRTIRKLICNWVIPSPCDMNMVAMLIVTVIRFTGGSEFKVVSDVIFLLFWSFASWIKSLLKLNFWIQFLAGRKEI